MSFESRRVAEPLARSRHAAAHSSIARDHQPARRGGAAAALVRAVRPRQFIKNTAVFLPLVFTAGLDWQPNRPAGWLPLLWRSCVAFVAFCLVASGEYLLNDAADVESDRQHPEKRTRPIAAGWARPSPPPSRWGVRRQAG